MYSIHRIFHVLKSRKAVRTNPVFDVMKFLRFFCGIMVEFIMISVIYAKQVAVNGICCYCCLSQCKILF